MAQTIVLYNHFITWRSQLVSFHISSQCAAALHSNTWLVLAVAVAAHFRKPPQLSQLHLYSRDMHLQLSPMRYTSQCIANDVIH